MKIMTITLELDGNKDETMDVQFSFLTAIFTIFKIIPYDN